MINQLALGAIYIISVISRALRAVENILVKDRKAQNELTK